LDETKFKTLEEERTDEMEMAEKENAERKEEEKSTIRIVSLIYNI
tara:strand:- start:196 stop:330 length:135 start_codon:yes stop_codon:yes gene_type:complete